jgi:hypothetical protein
MTAGAEHPTPSAPGQAPVTIRGEDIVRRIAHWREGRLHRLELQLTGGDVVLLDKPALRMFHEDYLGLAIAPGGPGAT